MLIHHIVACAFIMVFLYICAPAVAQERQLTSTPKNHNLDNNDNFSPDNRFLVYDTREMYGPGIDNSLSVEKVNLETGEETLLYAPTVAVLGVHAAPGAGAASYCASADTVAFIHGPMVSEVAERGWYGKPNRNGAEVIADGSRHMVWLDRRDADTSRDTLPGAHRGGTHRHEYTIEGNRIGFTYDDSILTQYGRTIGYMEKNAKAPEGATHYFAVLVPVVPKGTARAGELEQALGDAWVGRRGLMRAFIGKVRKDGFGPGSEDPDSYEESLFVVDIPEDVDITTADSGGPDRFPAPPKGVTIRRLTHSWASGIVRGTPDGDRIAYYAKAPDDTTQIFVIPSDGSDQSDDPAKRPVQLTRLEGGAGPGLRWHPSGRAVLCTHRGAVVSACAVPGADLGKTVYLTPTDEKQPREELAISWDGRTIAYTRLVPTQDGYGNTIKTWADLDCRQIFVLPYPEGDTP